MITPIGNVILKILMTHGLCVINISMGYKI